jgi:surface antigen/peptidyl-tRNA hydrolase
MSGRSTRIRNQNLSDATNASTYAIKQSLLSQHKHTQKKHTAISGGKVTVYTAIFVTLVGIIASGYQKPEASLSQVQSSGSSLATTVFQDRDTDAPSVDKIVATDVAASITERTSLPIAPNVASAAVSLSTKSELAQNDDKVVSKPQIIQSAASSRTIKTYVAKSGDTVDDVADKYNVSANTIRWANNLDSDAIKKGKKLTILPTNGIRYTYKNGDSLKQLATKYKTSEARIVAYNDLELSKPKKGQKLIIPSGILPSDERPGYQAPVVASVGAPTTGGGGYGGGYTVLNKNLNASAGNRYALGNCTWYAYERRAELGRPVGSFWGNGGSWAYSAQAAGYVVNSTPKPGSLQVYYGSPGHVAIVESVKENGDIVLSEMNYAGNFNRVTGRSMSAGQAAAYVYIHDKR